MESTEQGFMIRSRLDGASHKMAEREVPIFNHGEQMGAGLRPN